MLSRLLKLINLLPGNRINILLTIFFLKQKIWGSKRLLIITLVLSSMYCNLDWKKKFDVHNNLWLQWEIFATCCPIENKNLLLNRLKLESPKNFPTKSYRYNDSIHSYSVRLSSQRPKPCSLSLLVLLLSYINFYYWYRFFIFFSVSFNFYWSHLKLFCFCLLIFLLSA